MLYYYLKKNLRIFLSNNINVISLLTTSRHNDWNNLSHSRWAEADAEAPATEADAEEEAPATEAEADAEEAPATEAPATEAEAEAPATEAEADAVCQK